MATILLIEDNKETARLVKKILEPRGHTIVHTISGLDGLKLARTAHPDLVLLDFDLPDIEGKVVANKLRAEANPPRIVAFTAEAGAKAKRLALAFGCNDFISKPIDTRTFPECVERIGGFSRVNLPNALI